MQQDWDVLIGIAAHAYREGRLEEAFLIARDVLKARPGDLEAMLLMGVVAARQQQMDIAIPLLTHVAEQDPSSFQAHYWLSQALRRAGKMGEACDCAAKAVALNGEEPQALFQLGLCQKELENWRSAESALQKAAKLAPNVAPILYHLGIVLNELGSSTEAAQAFRRALAINPNLVDALYRLGESLAHDLDFRGAALYGERILKIDPRSVAGYSLLATALVGLNKPTEASDHLARAEEYGPNRADTLAHSGTLLQAIGRIDDADDRFRRSIEIEPKQGYAYYARVRTRRLQDADLPLIRQMESVAADAGLARRHRGYIEYALGKAYADLGDPETAMTHYDAANRVVREWKFGATPLDRQEYRRGIDFAVRNLDADFVNRHRTAGLPDALPIFVVGMMRSGTTLAEQILSSHSEIGAAGEQRFWSEHRGAAFEAPGNVVNQDRLRRLASEYLEHLRSITPGNDRVVDKMPDNYAHLGLIHVALPHARIIHVRRHPIDTCLSIWMTPNSSRIPWSNDKGDIVFAYRQYLRVMEHWRGLLGSDRLLEVDYEDLVADPEPVIRRMIDFCGLPWDEQCLTPERNTRSVATPSDWQVRQPVYKSAVGRWRSFQPWLGEFLDLNDRPHPGTGRKNQS